MSSIGTGYDLDSTTWSPQGRVFQVEYAGKAVDNAGTALALRGKDGVVFAVEYIVKSKLYEKEPHHRIFNIRRHIGMATSGLIADGRMVANEARDQAHKYESLFGGKCPVKVCSDKLSSFFHQYCVSYLGRPIGASVLLGGYDEVDGPQLYMIEPSGESWGYYGCAVGKGKQAARSEIEKLKLSEMTCAELVKEAARIIYAVHDEIKDKDFNLFMSWVSKDTEGKHELVPEDVFNEAEAYAKAAKEDDDDDDDDDSDEDEN
jgi:20S proteasome subunit alpha 7